MQSTSEKVFDYIRDQIVNENYAPGEFLSVKLLENELLVSPVPIRESLIRLVERGLLCWVRNRGFLVKELTKSDLELNCKLLSTVYCHAVARAFSKQCTFILEEIPQQLQSEFYEEITDSVRKQLLNEDEHIMVNSITDKFYSIRIQCVNEHAFIEHSTNSIATLSEFIRIGDKESAIIEVKEYFSFVEKEMCRIL